MKNQNGSVIILIFILCFFSILKFSSQSKDLSTYKPKTQSDVRKSNIKNQFSPWNGKHYNLTKVIKKNIKVPSSYEHISTRYWDRKDHITVETIFTAKNSFGVPVKTRAWAKAALNGQIYMDSFKIFK